MVEKNVALVNIYMKLLLSLLYKIDNYASQFILIDLYPSMDTDQVWFDTNPQSEHVCLLC